MQYEHDLLEKAFWDIYMKTRKDINVDTFEEWY